ncbi:Zn-dependent protease with chaperone function [Micromonospora pattaloongensis]|uniref:Zn-dependent protease with chaperone function n=1 Tax=Micromonospora pattaloongensis TaxID=405436 RepID=A0A1H3HJ83_9ACTN|nr:M48 family metallopeptidase [Micromonospora pattaloongensis]SDY15613.1 Zn-dependent protease with chaperone function [Micromonospora pattaloongensis]
MTIREAVPWCPRCEWNLDRYEPKRHRPEFGWQWIDRRTHGLAYRLTRQQFTALAQRPLEQGGLGPARIVTVTASVLLLAAVALLAAAGGWLLVAYRFPGLNMLVGIVALAVAFTLRPRFGRLDPELEVLTRERAPALFRLIDEVATVIGAPTPDIVALDEGRLNAYATCVGVRRRRVLCLGLPLWGSLPPQERVALLGHELGHFVNGDSRRLLLTQPAFTMLANAADLVRPVDTVRGAGLLEMVGALLAHVVQATMARLLFGAHLLLLWVALRDTQRAEYLADEMAARVAGSAAAASLSDSFLLADVIDMLVRRDARAGHGPARWRRTADEARAANAGQLPLLRQLSIRDDVSLFATHPPNGLRARMITERTWREPAVALTEPRAAQIDAELSREYERTRRALAWNA